MSNPQITASRLIQTRYPDCLAAFLAGSIVRGEGTATSDLDIVIVTHSEPDAPYRCSEMVGVWPVEFFVHTPSSLEDYFTSDIQRRRPSLVQMCFEGLILSQKDDQAETIKQRAFELLEKGPPPLSPSEETRARYYLTDLLDDFRGCENREENLQIAPLLAQHAADFYLAQQSAWSGQGKWLWRALHKAAPDQAILLQTALENFYCHNQKSPLIDFCTTLLEAAGGPLFSGFDSRKL